MKIERITVRAGRCVPHPLHSYGNLKADLEVVAVLEEGDDPQAIKAQLQQQIESEIEQHMLDLREGIRDLQSQSNTRERIKRLESDLAAKQKELDDLNEEFAERPLLAPRKAKQ